MSAGDDNNEKDVSVRLCPVCNKRVFDQDAASVTQWIFRLYGCTCKSKQLAEPVYEEPRVASAEVTICTNCGKRIRDANEGSLTQWIFQSHTCNCGMPRPSTGGGSIAPGANADAEVPTQLSPATRYEPAQSGEILSDPVLSAWLKEMDRYAPVKVLGKGASGSVYLCIDNYLQKPVAVKILNWITDDNIVAFQNEAKVASGLNHPYIVKVLDIGVTAGAVPFMVMDFIEGESLEDYLAHPSNNACVPEEDALDYAVMLLDALSYLHQHGIYHRDLKSGNLILCRDSDADERLHPVLVDLGLAAKAPSSGQPVGTVGYMAPEYIAGGAYGLYSEIYSFGCLLFEMLTGSLPYRGDSLLETLAMHSDAEIPSLKSRRDDIEFSPGLDALVQRCMAKKETERFQSLSELKAAIEAVGHGIAEEEKVPKEETLVASPASASLNKGVLLSALSIALVVIGGSLYITMRSPEGENDGVKSLVDKPDEERINRINQINQNNQKKQIYKVADIPGLNDTVEGTPVNGYIKESGVLLVTGEGARHRLKDHLEAGDRIRRIELSCIDLRAEDIALIDQIKPEVLKLFQIPNIDATIFSNLARIKSLRDLSIVRSVIVNQESLAGLGDGGSINYLMLQDCNLNDACFSALENIKSLKVLDVSLNPKVTAAGLRKLKDSGLERVRIYGVGPLTSQERERLAKGLSITIDSQMLGDTIDKKELMVSYKIPEDSCSFWQRLGQFYCDREDYGLSVGYYRASLAGASQERRLAIYARLGSVFGHKNDYRASIENNENALKIFNTIKDPDAGLIDKSILIRRSLSKAYGGLGDYEKSLAVISEVIDYAAKHNASTDGMYKERLKLRLTQKNYQGALDDLDWLEKNRPNNLNRANSLKTRAEILHKLGRDKDARAVEQKLETLDDTATGVMTY